MRVIKSETGFLYYQKIFKQLMNNQCKVVVWQINPTSGKREVKNSRINSFNLESGKLFFEIDDKGEVETTLPLYCYAEDGPLIFKADIDGIIEKNISTQIPSEIKLLEDPDIIVVRGKVGEDLGGIMRTKRIDTGPVDGGPDYMKVKSMAQRSNRDQELLNNEFGPVNLDEEDKLFADKRESPRARPKNDKYVKVARLQGEGPQTYKLFDLSRGGMGFIVYDEAEFSKGASIHVVGFNDFDLDDPLVGKVMSIRPVDETQVEFKVGVKFDDGQA